MFIYLLPKLITPVKLLLLILVLIFFFETISITF